MIKPILAKPFFFHSIWVWGDEIELGVKYTLTLIWTWIFGFWINTNLDFPNSNPNLEEKGKFHQNWLDHVM